MSKKHRGQIKGDPVTYETPLPAGGVQLETFLSWTLVRRGLKKQVITPLDAPQAFLDEARRERQAREMAQDTPLMRALGLAHHWQRLMDAGRFASITEIAEAEGLDLGRASRIARLAQLAPSIVEACATGTAAGLTLESVSRRAIPQRWDEQRERLRLA
ncbi:LacI family transcriptional regulator [Thermomonas alba]|uniref:LacI family transcriptional regulator n=1 Tax=Thermomonas alba TaxID=2888525 RepID=UPI001F038E46|nr:LacI family transcriptional regulator [Thermomonas alba]